MTGAQLWLPSTTPGALDHITVTPSTASIVTSGTQAFSAQGYDASNNPISGLTYTWSATTGTIDSSGNYTAPGTAGSDTVTATVSAVSGTAAVTVSGGASDEPVYTPATDTVVYVGDSTDTTYADATTAGAVSPSRTRMVPEGSPVYNGAAVDTTAHQITTGKGGAGKALVYKYIYDAGAQNGAGWVLYLPGSYAATTPTIIRGQIACVGPTPTYEIASKFLRLPLNPDGSGGGAPQWSLHNAIPFSGGPGKYSYWQYYGAGYTDEYDAYPTGHDQGTQPVGPYVEDLFAATATYHRFTFAYRDNSSVGANDGYARMWIDGVKIIDVSYATIGVTPSGGFKQWCSADEFSNAVLTGQTTDGTYGATFGGTQYLTGVPTFQFQLNIGDADPTNLDTLLIFTR